MHTASFTVRYMRRISIHRYTARWRQPMLNRVARRRRSRQLSAFLDSLDAKYGPVDEALVAKHEELL
jgi:hypothetical protein